MPDAKAENNYIILHYAWTATKPKRFGTVSHVFTIIIIGRQTTNHNNPYGILLLCTGYYFYRFRVFEPHERVDY